MKTLLVASIVSLGLFASSAPSHPTTESKFLDQLSEHHLDAIKMADIAEKKAANPELKNMAKEMKETQKKEIEQMAQWRKEYFANVPKTKSVMQKMNMDSLEKKSGKDFDFAFIDMMKKHHEQGIEMAKSAQDGIFHSNIKDFAQNVVEEQSKEKMQLDTIKKEEKR